MHTGRESDVDSDGEGVKGLKVVIPVFVMYRVILYPKFQPLLTAVCFHRLELTLRCVILYAELLYNFTMVATISYSNC